ncbi:mitochondrial ribosomal protein of small subunit [Scheffersomyces coipomensis]|uniref:mitochondrial ribosomal protein of small subunit n=1 Tax=Scheffersomyces coipomensis TaxID=1788519 RepID=UPI00315D1B0F
MGKGVLKYGGKSGILPKIRPVFKHNPIRSKTPSEIQQESQIEQGYAKDVPLPQNKGNRRNLTFHRVQPPKEIITVEQRIKNTIENRIPQNIDESKLNNDEKWVLKRDEIRREFLREAYLTEAKRLEKLDKLKENQLKKQKEAEQNHLNKHQESEAVKLTIPTIESYLKGPIMRQRTPEETLIKNEQRLLNRKTKELEEQSKKATQLLDLYHSASNFITTEEELEAAITEAFEVRVTDYDRSLDHVKNKLNSTVSFAYNSEYNRGLIEDKALGELNGKPGLETVKDVLSGEAEKIKRQAEIAANEATSSLPQQS